MTYYSNTKKSEQGKPIHLEKTTFLIGIIVFEQECSSTR